MNRSFNKPRYNNYKSARPDKKSPFPINSYFNYQDGPASMIDILDEYIKDNINPMIYKMFDFRHLHNAIQFQTNNNWSDNNYIAMIKATESEYMCIIEYAERNKPNYYLGIDYSDPKCFDGIIKFVMRVYNGQ